MWQPKILRHNFCKYILSPLKLPFIILILYLMLIGDYVATLNLKSKFNLRRNLINLPLKLPFIMLLLSLMLIGDYVSTLNPEQNLTFFEAI